MASKVKPKIKVKTAARSIPQESDSTVSEQILDLGHFSQIIHISDIHIRPWQRHQEYTEVFDVLDETIDRLQSSEPSLIVVTGDIFDKPTFRPETFKLCRGLFKMLKRHCPVIIIAGKHDIPDQRRMDGITPVVEDIDNVYYLKASGVYHSKHTDHSFVVSSLHDGNFIRLSDIQSDPDRRYIALYHGTVLKVEDNDELGEQDGIRDIADFKGYDAVILGGLHQNAIITDHAAYAGSIVQQDFSEGLKHGIMVWNEQLQPRTEWISNRYGYADVHIGQDQWEWVDHEPPENCHLRLIAHEASPTYVDLVVAELRNQYNVLSISKKYNTTAQSTPGSGTQQDQELDSNLDLIRKDDEISLIRQIAAGNQHLDQIIELHRQYADSDAAIQACSEDNTAMISAAWKPVSLEFKNMFGYGQGKVRRINFKRGVTAIVSGNATGKTSIVNILLFAIYGRTLLNPTGNAHTYDIINNKETSGYVKLLLKHGEKFYLIERSTTRTKSKKTAVPANAVLQMLKNYEFTSSIWESNIKGEKVVEYSHKDWSKQLFGTIEDFSLCNLLNKESSLDLLSMTPADQVKTLKRLFKINVYDTYRELNKQALATMESQLAEKNAKLAGIKTTLPDDPDSEDECDLLDEKEELEHKISDLRVTKSDTSEKIKDLNDQIKTKNHQAVLLWSKEVAGGTGIGDETEGEGTGEAEAEGEAEGDGTGEAEGDGAGEGESVRELMSKIKIIKSDLQPPEAGRLQQLETDRDEINDVIKTLTAKLPATFKTNINESASALNRDISRLTDQETKCLNKISLIDEELGSNKISGEAGGKGKTEIETETGGEGECRSIPQIRDQIRILEDRNLQLPKISSNNNYEGKTDESLGYVLNVVKQADIKNAKAELARIQAKLNAMEGDFITDHQACADHLASCPLLDDDIKDAYGLNPLVSYCIVEEETVNKIGKHLSHGIGTGALIALLTSRAVQQEKINRLEKMVADNITITNNIQKLQRDNLAHIEQYRQELQRALFNEKKTLLAQLETIAAEREVLEDKLTIINAKLDLKDIQREYQHEVEAARKAKMLAALEAKLVKRQAIEYKQHLSLLEQIAVLKEDHGILVQQDHDIREQLKLSIARLEQIERKLSVMEYKRTQHAKFGREVAQLETEIEELNGAIIPLQEYHELMGNKGGVTSTLLYNRIKALEDYINSILSNYTRYSVVIVFDEKKQSISIVTQERSEDEVKPEFLSVSRLSGYEKLMIQISFKRALNKFSYNSKASFIIIDEAMDCIDQDNFGTKLPDVIGLLTQDYTVCLAISQRDIQHISDYNIKPSEI